MNKFIEEMMDIGVWEDRAGSEIERRYALKAAEELYEKHLEELNLSTKNLETNSRLIESILFEQVGEYPKRLKYIQTKNTMINTYGLVRINGEYYKWVTELNENK